MGAVKPALQRAASAPAEFNETQAGGRTGNEKVKRVPFFDEV